MAEISLAGKLAGCGTAMALAMPLAQSAATGAGAITLGTGVLAPAAPYVAAAAAVVTLASACVGGYNAPSLAGDATDFVKKLTTDGFDPAPAK